ncbi:carcinoembryonic antigen-related cell adhesion molecule 19 isoform X2 [Pipistrellus kuhlii]|uniref:carcinoembryonic antigen-related cell adhesion molecule 19 isoform X2 n=1 Tax=Pipistrellus kuhlii TaxID=59472 RepID=UPI001E273AB6|nr:carcinoembryonic antigen-related cell adhesion molecule 19 isoform X2 [Pipistrellus kuhlii]
MEMPVGTLCHFSKGLLLSASVLALWAPQGSWAALRIQKIPERPQKDQDVLLSVQGIPDTFQDFIWYRGEETDGGTRLFTYIPDLPRPQRDGSAMEQRDIVGFPNGSMLLRDAQPRDSGTYHVEVHINPEWTMRAKTEVQVPEKSPELPVTRLPMSTEVVAAILIGSLAAASLLVGSIAFLLVTRGRRGQRHRMVTTEKPELGPNHNTGDNIYEAVRSPVLLASPLHGPGSLGAASDLLNPAPAPYCQLVPTPWRVPARPPQGPGRTRPVPSGDRKPAAPLLLLTLCMCHPPIT